MAVSTCNPSAGKAEAIEFLRTHWLACSASWWALGSARGPCLRTLSWRTIAEDNSYQPLSYTHTHADICTHTWICASLHTHYSLHIFLFTYILHIVYIHTHINTHTHENKWKVKIHFRRGFCTSKNITYEKERATYKWENISIYHIYDKGTESRVPKEHSKLGKMTSNRKI